MCCQALKTLRGLVGTPLSTQMRSSGTLSDGRWDCRDQRQMGLLTLCWDPLSPAQAALPMPTVPTEPPFLLTLRLWDAYILEGGHLLTAMAYTVLKVHRRKWA